MAMSDRSEKPPVSNMRALITCEIMRSGDHRRSPMLGNDLERVFMKIPLTLSAKNVEVQPEHLKLD